MSYRDDRDAMRERIELLEKKAASAVSPEELGTLRGDLAAAKERLDSEREALDALLGRIDGKAPTPANKARWRLLGVAAAVVVLALFGGVMALVQALPEDRAPTYRGAPNAVRVRPVRREVDREVARLLPDLDGCLPEGSEARIQVEMIFEGHNGGAREITSRNISYDQGYPASTPECLEGVLRGVGTAPFSAPSYRYHLTLEWSDGRLQPPPLWERYDLARDPRTPR